MMVLGWFYLYYLLILNYFFYKYCKYSIEEINLFIIVLGEFMIKKLSNIVNIYVYERILCKNINKIELFYWLLWYLF